MTPSYNAQSTTNDVTQHVSLKGKTFVVTGTSSGLGAETARALAAAGGRVVMVARDAAKNQRCVEQILSEVPEADLPMVTMEMADLQSIRDGAAQILKSFPKIDALINNAGFIGKPKQLINGLEAHLAINHVAPFLLTNLLLPALKAVAPSRIVLVASNAHRAPAYDIDDLNFDRRPYDEWSAYAQSKRASVLYATALSSRLAGTGVTVNVLHPGVIRTEAFRHFSEDEREQSIKSGEQYGVVVKSLEQGAATQVWAASAPELETVTGTYLEDCQIAPRIASTEIATNGVIDEALDPEAAERLWQETESIIGDRFS